jgi:cytidylate kinase
MTAKHYKLPSLKGKIVALDGPAGSGKSTTAKILAARLGYRYLDTGAMYRALTWFATQNGVPPSDGKNLSRLAASLTIEFVTEEEVNRVYINGQEVTAEIRTPEVNSLVSEVAAHKGVREVMVAKQQSMGAKGDVVAEGRDTTTVVFPHADIKIYLDCDVQSRAERRLIEMARAGVTTNLEEQIAEIERRDKHDSERQHSPLRQAKDAFVVDTTAATIEEQVDRVFQLLKSAVK